VHDENAWALGGDAMCGHAGLFGRASDVARLGAAVLDVLAGRVPGWLEPNEIEPLLRRRPGGTLRAGFDGKSVEGSSAGALCSRDAFGHLGFTGSSLWIDPASEAAVTLLCNRVHPNRDNERIKCARPVAHQALFLWASERRA
jgi:CubicO group peptidase (beta-lactamase class C family)